MSRIEARAADILLGRRKKLSRLHNGQVDSKPVLRVESGLISPPGISRSTELRVPQSSLSVDQAEEIAHQSMAPAHDPIENAQSRSNKTLETTVDISEVETVKKLNQFKPLKKASEYIKDWRRLIHRIRRRSRCDGVHDAEEKPCGSPRCRTKNRPKQTPQHIQAAPRKNEPVRIEEYRKLKKLVA